MKISLGRSQRTAIPCLAEVTGCLIAAVTVLRKVVLANESPFIIGSRPTVLGGEFLVPGPAELPQEQTERAVAASSPVERHFSEKGNIR